MNYIFVDESGDPGKPFKKVNGKKIPIRTCYRCINKETYKGTFAVDGNKKLHNVFDEYNLVKTVYFAAKEKDFTNAEVIIDRAERRLLSGNFANFDKYLFKKLNTKTIQRVKFVTHANSEYVFLMQMSDLVCGVIKDHIVGENKDLKKMIGKGLLRKVW